LGEIVGKRLCFKGDENPSYFSLTAKDKVCKRKAALKLGLRLPSFPQLPVAGMKTRFAQTVHPLLPQAIASLGCVERDRKDC